MSQVERAVELFRGGCACSQAVLGAYAPDLGVKLETALRLSSGFGGGMRMAETCGAVTGALMVLGLRHAGAACSTSEGRASVNAKVIDFVARYRARRGSVACRDLLGCDISTPEGAAAARERNLFKTTCVELVREAAQMLEEHPR